MKYSSDRHTRIQTIPCPSMAGTYSISAFPAARYYNSDLSIWLSVDPLVDKYPNLSPYVYCANNPVRLVDPNGEDWYEDENGAIKWTDCKSQNDMAANGLQGTYLGEAHIVFSGYRWEHGGQKNGKGNYINGEGAINAAVTLYGPDGEKDIHHFTGYTMTSNATKYIPIDEGLYEGAFKTKGGSLPSKWALLGNVETMDKVLNTNPECMNDWNYNTPWKTGIFIHSTGQNGSLGTRNSTGCLLILDSDWAAFSKAMASVTTFSVRVERYAVRRVPLEGINGVIPNRFVLKSYLKRD